MSDGRNHNFVIQTRQKEDALYASSELLAVGATLALPVRLVAGYGAVKFLAFSDVMFRIRIEQAPASDGPWTETHRVNSGVNGGGIDQVACLAILPCGSFMRVFVDNIGAAAMTSFSLSGTGHPIANGAVEIGDSSPASNVNLRDCATTTEASIKPDGGGISPSPCDGGLLVAGRDGAVQRHIRVNSGGNLTVAGAPGTSGTSPADTPVGVGATVPLTAPPAGTRRMTVEVTSGSALTLIRVRELAGAAGTGRLLVLLGSTTYGGLDGAVFPLEVENVAGPAATVHIDFEG